MSVDVIPRPVGSARSGRPPGRNLAVVVRSGLMAMFAVIAGLLLTCGLGVVLWAITPSTAAGPVAMVRAGITAFSAANGMTVQIGRAALTLPPLMITAVAIALLASITGGREIGADRSRETVAVVTAAVVYAAAVTAAGAVLGSPHAIRADQWWRPALLALVVVATATLVRGIGWRAYLLDRLPPWVPVSVRLGAIGFAGLLGVGAITLLIGLVRSLGDAITVGTLAAPSAAGGFGMALLSIAYLPNAVIAGIGYSTGVGFTIGAGSYSPFGSSPVELPAVSLLTAAPDGHPVSRLTLLLLVLPVLVAVLMGRCAVRRLDLRSDRLLSVGGAALLAALGLAVLAALASGGVTGGEWSSSGAPPLLLGAVVAVLLSGVGAAVAGVARVPAAVIGKRGRSARSVGGEEAGRAEVTEIDLADAGVPAAGVPDAGVPAAGVRAAGLPDDAADDAAADHEVADTGPGTGADPGADDEVVAADDGKAARVADGTSAAEAESAADHGVAADAAPVEAPTADTEAARKGDVPGKGMDVPKPEASASTRTSISDNPARGPNALLPEADLLSRPVPDAGSEVAAELARRPPRQVG